MKILIADDHEIVREGLKKIIEEAPDIAKIGEASNANELLEKMRSSDWDLFIVDINMPGKSGLDVLRDIKKEAPKIPVLILSVYPEDQYAIRVMRAGASGYIMKSSAGEELIKAIRKVVSGGRYISETVADKLAEIIDDSYNLASHELLSDREYQVFLMIANGKTVGEIALEISLSVKTISTYRTHILEKMHLKNNADIMQYAIKNRLI